VDIMGAVLVLVDGTAGGALALFASLRGARASSARVVLLAVPRPLWVCSPGSAGASSPRSAAGEWDAESRESAQTYVDRLARGLGLAGIDASARTASGPRGATIVSVADEVGADMIVMSTERADDDADGLVLGGTADEVLRTSHCPVLVLRRGRQPAAFGRVFASAPNTN
jgi:nucleotide-binding universal stress UspA family protein